MWKENWPSSGVLGEETGEDRLLVAVSARDGREELDSQLLRLRMDWGSRGHPGSPGAIFDASSEKEGRRTIDLVEATASGSKSLKMSALVLLLLTPSDRERAGYPNL